MSGYRKEACIIEGFNLVVIDVDGTADIDTVKLLLREYMYLLYTTKSHKPEEHRFRIILPTSHVLKMTKDDYKEFMNNVYDWLPFEVDRQTADRSRKWETFKGDHFYNDGQKLDVLAFIPRTKKADDRKQQVLDQVGLSNMERWFVNNTNSGNRNSQFIRYALMLVDSGKSFDQILESVINLNDKMPDKLPEDEINNTIMRTVSVKIKERDNP